MLSPLVATLRKRQIIGGGVLLLVVILSSIVVLHRQPRLTRISGEHHKSGGHSSSGHGPGGHTSSEGMKIDEQCLGNHFPDAKTRHLFASEAVWQCNNTIQPEFDFPKKTFLMLKTGTEVMWERLPVHFMTTLQRYPHHALYSDGSGRIGGLEVVDTLADLPEELMMSQQLSAYRARNKSIEEGWGWSADEIQADGGWDNDKFKNVPMLLHAWQHAPDYIEWFMFIDDDTFMLTESIEDLVKPFNPKEHYYFGTPAISSGSFPESGRVGEKIKAEKGYVSMAFAHGGTGVVISRGALDAVFENKNEEQLKEMLDHYAIKNKDECCGDAMVAYMLREEIELYLNAALPDLYSWPHGGSDLKSTRVVRDKWCLPLRSFHHIRSWEIDVLHKWESTLAQRRKHLDLEHSSLGNDDPTPLKHPDEEDHDLEAHHKTGPITHSDFYRDFILPYISEEREGWEIFPDSSSPTYHDKDEPLTIEEGRIIRPSSDREHCKLACVAQKDCLGWQWVQGECKLEINGIVRGRAVNSLHKKFDGKTMWSGYLFDRILDIRHEARCDPYRHDLDQTDEALLLKGEGWYFRALEDERENLSREA